VKRGCVSFALFLLILACGGPPPSASKNRTFYDWAVATGDGAQQEFELPYPPLDLVEQAPNPAYVGVSVLRGGVRLSKPSNWRMRDAGNVPGQAYLSYISPNAYSFALYERPDSPRDPWRDVMGHYESDAKMLGARIATKRVPVSTGIGQGRAYTVEREVEAAKRPLLSRSREYLVRGQTRIILLQIVHQGEIAEVDDELLRVIDTLEVL
jgi:hypothetical protein